MLALILTRKLRPIAIGSLSGWLTLSGSTTRPAASSDRTCSGVQPSRTATNSISGVITPCLAYRSWVTVLPGSALRGCRVPAKTLSRLRWSWAFSPLSIGCTGRPSYRAVSARSSIQGCRSAGRPSRMSVRSEVSV